VHFVDFRLLTLPCGQADLHETQTKFPMSIQRQGNPRAGSLLLQVRLLPFFVNVRYLCTPPPALFNSCQPDDDVLQASMDSAM
jgi:hypothetical protein